MLTIISLDTFWVKYLLNECFMLQSIIWIDTSIVILVNAYISNHLYFKTRSELEHTRTDEHEKEKKLMVLWIWLKQ